MIMYYLFNADTRIKRLGCNYFNVLNRNVLKSLSLYGQNNVGKSKVLYLFKLIKSLMLGIENVVFNGDIFGDTPECDISITYKTENDKNWMEYSFAYDSLKKVITKETLNEVTFYETGNSSSKLVYKRDVQKGILVIDDKELNELSKFLPSKKPFLYCVSIENDAFESLKIYLDSFKNFVNSIEIMEVYNIPIEKTINALKDNNETKKRFIVEFIKHADLSVQDFIYDENAIIKTSNENIISEEILKSIDVIDTLKLITKYEDKVVSSIIFDSTGTKRIEVLASYLYEAIICGKTLIIDEFDNGLHFKLTRAILSLFNSFSNERGQLIFTAHDVGLISSKFMMRKDQIYFSFRNEDLTSSIFCLKDAPVS